MTIFKLTKPGNNYYFMQRGGALCPLRKRKRRGSPSLVSKIHIWGKTKAIYILTSTGRMDKKKEHERQTQIN